MVDEPVTALVVVDVQNDFCEGGSLAVAGGAEVASAVAGRVASGRYAGVVATQDWHHDPGAHFSDSPDYVDTWPAHCRAGSEGAQLHDALSGTPFDAVFRKGAHTAAYSGFEGELEGTEDQPVVLAEWLRRKGIEALDVVGIATDHCVRATALDARREGFATRVLLGLTAGVAPGTTRRAMNELRAADVDLVGQPLLKG